MKKKTEVRNDLFETQKDALDALFDALIEVGYSNLANVIKTMLDNEIGRIELLKFTKIVVEANNTNKNRYEINWPEVVQASNDLKTKHQNV